MAEELTTASVAGVVYASRGLAPSSTLTKWITETSSNLERLQVPDSVSRKATSHYHAIPPPASRDGSLGVDVDSMQAMSSLASNNAPSLDHTIETLSSGISSPRDSRTQSSIQGSSFTSARPYNNNSPGREVAATTYQCPLHFLKCRQSFESRREWYMHSLCHFRGKEPPKTAHCPFPSCPHHWQAEKEEESAWAPMMAHLADHHFERGDRLMQECRPERSVLSHLLRTKVLSKEEVQNLVQGDRGGEMYPVACVMNNPGQDRRDGIPGPAASSSRRARYNH